MMLAKLFLCICLYANLAQPLNVIFNPNSDNEAMVNNGQLQDDFYYDVSWGQCSVPALYIYKQTDIQQLSNAPTTIRL